MDEKIVDLFWNREEDAIRQTEQQYGGYLQKIAYNILSDQEDSKECVNDACLAAWRSIPPHRPKVLRSYLAKLTRQIAIDRLRNRKSVKRKVSQYTLSLSELSDTFSCGDSVEEAFSAELLRQTIGRFLHTLPKETQIAFLGRYYYFDSLKEVAAYCGMKESKLKSLLYRTRQALKQYLIKEGFDL